MKNKVIHLMMLTDKLRFSHKRLTIKREASHLYKMQDSRVIYKAEIERPGNNCIYYFDTSKEAEYKQMLVKNSIEESKQDIELHKKRISEIELRILELELYERMMGEKL
jgi:hypothetical protein